MEITLTRELVELKHDVLIKRIEKIKNDLQIISIVAKCENEMNSIKIIKQQYKKMYQAILVSGEYDKYQEVENTIISEIAKIESKVDKYIYYISKRYDGILDECFKGIRESENYKNFNQLDKELEKIKQLKAVLEYCKTYFSRVQENQINTKISTFKFELLIRRQIEQMVYRNGVANDRKNSSKLKQYDSQSEAECFCTLLEKIIGNIKDDEVLKKYTISQILADNTLLNHALFKLIEQDLEKEPEKYMPLLRAKIFNAHMCNIANNPYTEKIPYAKGKNPSIGKNEDELIEFSVKSKIDPYFYYFKRDRANLSLLRVVLDQMIKRTNTTIMECCRIYNRFGFECRPITISEGQEIVRKIYEKTKHKIEPRKPKVKLKGQFARISFTGYDYNFESKEEQFLTNAQMNHKIKDIKSKAKSIDHTISIDRIQNMLDEHMTYESMLLSDMSIVAWLRDKLILEITGQSNSWARETLEMMRLKRPERPAGIMKRRYIGLGRYKNVREYNETELWKSYKTDFEEMGIQIKAISHDTNLLGEKDHTIAISLDDIADLPIDFESIHILSNKEVYKLEELEDEER